MDTVADLWAEWDSLCSGYVRAGFAAVGCTELLGEPAASVAHLPLIRSPTPVITCILAYLLFVAAALLRGSPKKGAAGAADSMALRVFVQLHNVFLVALSAFMFGGIVLEAVRNGYIFWGNNYDPTEVRMAHMIYIFYISKIYEFLDTVIMILKGNLRQVTFLHVYHHASISVVWWAVTNVAPGGDAYYSAALNSLVHVVMYMYYLLASAIGKDEKRRKKYLWWGKYLTMFQMTQFASNLTHAIYCLNIGRYNVFLAKLMISYMVTLLFLFGNFFLQKYVSPKPKSLKKSD